MAVMSRLLPLVAFSTFAIFVLALLATPANALSNGPHGHVARGHDSIAKRKRNPVKRAKRCRPKTTSLSAASTSPAAAATTSPAAAATTSSVPSSTKAAAATTPESSKPATTKATTKTSTSAAATSTPSSGGGSGGGGGLSSSKKLLLAWPNGPTDLEKYQGDNVGGMYTWSPYCPDNAKTLNIPCYPMLWGTKQKSVFTQQVSSDYNSLIFGFNEPNQGDQSNMTPQAAAALWIASVEPLRAKQGCKLVSPATTSAPTGIQWMKDMLAACNGGCTFDYVALHWYGTSIDEFKTYVNKWYDAFGKPLIISEYACQNFSGGAQCTKDQTNTFHYTMGAWFDQHPGVAMYGPFGFMHDMVNVNYDNQLMNSDGSPNDLAKWYLYH